MLVARIFFLALTLGWLTTGFWLVNDSTFRLGRVEARGAYYLTADAVNAAVGNSGESVFWVSTVAATDRVLALGVPRSAAIFFRLPDVIVVAVRERTSAYGWKVGSTTFAVSDDGVILGPTDGTDPRVVVDDRRGRTIRPGERVDQSVLREAGYLADTLPPIVGMSASTLQYSDETGVVVAAPNHVRIIFGDDKTLDQKLAALVPTWSAALSHRHPASVLDLRVPARPIIR
jgi:cell division septal protein FtsQ